MENLKTNYSDEIKLPPRQCSIPSQREDFYDYFGKSAYKHLTMHHTLFHGDFKSCPNTWR